MPRVLVEVAADELAVHGPCVERVGRRGDAKEAAAGSHEVDQRGPLRLAHGRFAGGEEHHGTVAPQVLRGEYRHVLGRCDFESRRRLAELLQYLPGRRDDLVAVTGRVGEIEKT